MVLPRNGISGFRLIIVTLLSLALTAGYDACNDTTCVQVDFKDCDNAVRSMVVLDCAEWLLDETGFPVAVRDAGRRIEPVLGNDSRRVSGKEVNWGFGRRIRLEMTRSRSCFAGKTDAGLPKPNLAQYQKTRRGNGLLSVIPIMECSKQIPRKTSRYIVEPCRESIAFRVLTDLLQKNISSSRATYSFRMGVDVIWFVL